MVRLLSVLAFAAVIPAALRGLAAADDIAAETVAVNEGAAAQPGCLHHRRLENRDLGHHEGLGLPIGNLRTPDGRLCCGHLGLMKLSGAVLSFICTQGGAIPAVFGATGLRWHVALTTAPLCQHVSGQTMESPCVIGERG